MYKISPNFTLAELTKSHIAIRYSIDNSADNEVIKRATLLAEEVLEKVRAKFGAFSPNSWFRCKALNSLIGSKDSSQHILGCAVDFEVPGHSNLEVAQWIKGNLDFDQLILENYEDGDPHSGWIHCSYVQPGKNRKQVLRFINGHYYEGLMEV